MILLPFDAVGAESLGVVGGSGIAMQPEFLV